MSAPAETPTANAPYTDSDLNGLRQALDGTLLLPRDVDYDQVRKVWNAPIDNHPALIVRCTGAADVIDSVKFARNFDLLVSVRCGGHSVSGKSVCEGGLMIDLSLMRGVHVDPLRQIARVEGGATLGRLDRESQIFGLATTTGVVTHTGVGGLTLGGGCGFLARKYGLTCDNLISADVVAADGRLLKASEAENADLFWGLRGGGGNFGIVTSFEFRLHAIGTEVVRAASIIPLDQAREALRFFREFAFGAPDEVSAGAAFITDESGEPVLALSACHIPPLDRAETVLAPLVEFGPPTATGIETLPYLQLQAAADAVFPYGQSYYWKTHFITELPDSAIDILIHQFKKVPGSKSKISFQHYGGAVGRVGPTETAFGNREAEFDLVPVAIWQDPAEAASEIAWVRETWTAMEPYASGGVYINNLGEDSEERIKQAVGPNYDRLVELKNKYDATNFFRLNANIKPTVDQPNITDE